jgi:hypothetical protein
MAKKDYYLIIDTETTQKGLVADFGCVLCDRQGRVVETFACLVDGVYTDRENQPLFHVWDDSNDLWSKKGLPKRYAIYDKMLEDGSRVLARVGAINNWLTRINAQYSPYITAYNFPFDRDKCGKTGINLAQFKDRYFCLWAASIQKWGHTKKFRQFCLDAHAFNAPTGHGNMTFKTNAEVMARFVLNDPTLPDEPHRALEDALYYELPILKRLLQTTPKNQIIDAESYNWRDFQVKDAFTAK